MADRLTAEATLRAIAAIHSWRAAPDQPACCPVCQQPGLRLSDHSARPHAEWYRLVCPDCGLDQMLNIPLGAAVPGGQE
jgi:hypothetical protein